MNTINSKKLGHISQIGKDFRTIVSFLSRKRKMQLFFLLMFQVVGGFSEMLSLGALLPFLSAISNAKELFRRPELQPAINFLGIENETQMIIYASVAFIAAFSFVNIFRIFTFWIQNKMSVIVGSDLARRFCNQILNQDFEYHLNANSGVLISRTITDLSSVLQFISGAMMISAQGVAVLSIITAIVMYDATSAFVIFSTTLVLYVIIARINKKQLIRNSYTVSDSHALTIRNLQIGLGGIRDVLLGNKQQQFLDRYTESDRAYRQAAANTQLLRILPRYLIEIAGVTILASMAAYYTVSQGGVFGTLPLMGALAMACIRILPAAQQIYNSFVGMQSVHVSVDRVLDILKLPIRKTKKSEEYPLNAPKNSIELSNVWFRFKGDREGKAPSGWVLKGVNLSIPVNKTIALVGKTGSGKTTISDIVLGFLFPEKGTLCVDGQRVSEENIASWRTHLASVPQSIFLIDATIKENIAFGEMRDEIDMDKVKQACKLSQIDDFIESRPEKYNEIMGENGIRLSGGQRQRIGIARALYKKASVMVLDEATSALDNKTEKILMQTIAELHGQQTILIIAHRLDTIKKADIIYEIQDGRVVAQGTFEELMRSSASFREIALAGEKEAVA